MVVCMFCGAEDLWWEDRVLYHDDGRQHICIRPNVNPAKEAYAQEMRDHPTPAEAALWEQLSQYDEPWETQAILLGWIVDFWHPGAGLAVELDGEVHDTSAQKRLDQYRDRSLAEVGVQVMRFRNATVLRDPDGVVDSIRAQAETNLRAFGEFRKALARHDDSC